MNALSARPQSVTESLPAALAGDADALERILRATYTAMRKIANQQLSDEHGQRNMSCTELVHESFLHIFAHTQLPSLNDSAHLLCVAARAMRQVLVDAARRRNAIKRLQTIDHLTLDNMSEALPAATDFRDLNSVLDRLADIDPRQARIVDLRFFVGLSEADIATALDISMRTVTREWRLARAWLRRELAPEPGGGL